MNTKDDLLSSQVDVCEMLRNRLGQLSDRPEDRPNPVITLTYAQSIDGCIAPIGGGALRLSNAETQRMTHEIRGAARRDLGRHQHRSVRRPVAHGPVDIGQEPTADCLG